jgi:creatinine amidohydrolase/Fe(II)-dependent formamide hydrolase-like protein
MRAASTALPGLFVLLLLAAPAWSQPQGVELDALTSTELAAAIAAGTTTVLVPIGGTEQSGSHIALGKHNARAVVLAERIAQTLGRTLVAPVIAYVPEGGVDPPTSHMRYAGTISIPVPAFEQVLTGAARSLRAAGFRTIVLLGDHGGYQASLQAVATRLTQEWHGSARVIAPVEYYRAASKDFAAALRARGFAESEIGVHAGLADTALSMALTPSLVRTDKLADAARAPGVTGDPRRASAELGAVGADLVVERTVAAIRAAQR